MSSWANSHKKDGKSLTSHQNKRTERSPGDNTGKYDFWCQESKPIF